jgi:NAD(P)-dependent dehydrogenase (short-subunit alcohol dehydrogenase family)
MDLGRGPPEMVSDMKTLFAIVGASSALGRMLAEDLCARGCIVAGTYNTGAPEIAGASLSMKCDVTREEDLETFAAACSGVADRIFMLYLAGLSRNAVAHRLSLKDWSEVIQVGLSGAFLAARAFLPGMRDAGWGRIVYAGSVVGRIGVPGTSAYGTVKEGLKGLTRAVAKENASKGITVNCLELGYMDAGLTYTIPEELRGEILKAIPAGGFGDPLNLAEAILFLEKADYVTGSVLSISGGL